MLAVPVATPVSVVVAPGEVTLAIPGKLLLQLPLVPSVNVIVAPAHTWLGPEKMAGFGLTVNTEVVKEVHPEPLVTV